jgi:DNA polymerase-3 subunit gamma/tau
MRDSQSLLEQLLAFGSKRITVADVNAMLGTAGGERLVALATHLVERNPAAALADLDQALAEGVDVGQLIDQLLGYFRDAMAAAVGCPTDALLHTAPSEQEAVAASAKQLGLETILAVMQILDHTLSRLRYSTHGRTLAELALVRIARLADLDNLAELVADLRNGATVDQTSRARPSPSVSTPLAKKKDELSDSPVGIVNEPHFRPAAAAAQTNGGLTSLENAQRIWEAALATVENLTADNARAASEVAIRAPNQLAVVFGTKYNFSKSFCERPDRAGQLQDAVSAVAGYPIRLMFELAVDSASNGGPRRVVSARQRKAELEAEICRRPLVERAVQLFGATVEVLEKPACSKESET